MSSSRCELDRVTPGGHRGFPNDEAVVFIDHIPAELPEVLMDMRAFPVVLDTGRDWQRESVRKPFFFRYECNNVLTESVHAHIQPEAHDVLDLFPDLRVVHVEIRLFFCKDVQVVLIRFRRVFPSIAFKDREPVVGSSASRATLAPNIIVAVRVVFAPAALLKPPVLIRGVVDYEIHYHFNVSFVRLIQNLFEDVQIPEFLVDIRIVGYVVSVIRVGRGVNRGKPDCVHSEALYIIEFFQNTVQIPYSVSVSVLERTAPDLIYGYFLKP